MKTAFHFALISTFTIFLLSTTYAQVEKNKINKVYSSQADGEKVIIKDGTTTMVEFVSQGFSGLIHLPSLGTLVSYPGNNLYSSGTDLYWGGSKLGTSGSAAGWTYSGTTIYNTTLTDKVGIGTTNPLSNLSVGGLGTSSATISGESTSGWGIYGLATTGRGIYGSASGTGGRGVFGSANGTGGEGVIAEAHGQNGRAISGYANDASGHAGYFGGNVQINGSTQLGSSGTPFLEIREITGTTNTYKYYTAIDALPLGWTAANTRLVSLEIQGFSNNWYSNGYSLDGNPIAIQFYNTNRNITVYYPEYTDFHNKPWRAVIMRMP